MSKTIKIIDNETIEIASYRNPEVVFHNSENPRHLFPEYDDFESYCDFKETINPFKMYAEIERLNNIIDRTTKYVESLSSIGRGCDIYSDIKKEILNCLKDSDKE